MICEEQGMMTEKVRKACKEVAKNDLAFVEKRGQVHANAFGYERSYTAVQKDILQKSDIELELIHKANLAKCQERIDWYKGLKGHTS